MTVCVCEYIHTHYDCVCVCVDIFTHTYDCIDIFITITGLPRFNCCFSNGTIFSSCLCYFYSISGSMDVAFPLAWMDVAYIEAHLSPTFLKRMLQRRDKCSSHNSVGYVTSLCMMYYRENMFLESLEKRDLNTENYGQWVMQLYNRCNINNC